MTLPIKTRACLAAATNLGPEDTTRFLDLHQQYVDAGATLDLAGTSAAADLLAEIQTEARDLGALIAALPVLTSPTPEGLRADAARAEKAEAADADEQKRLADKQQADAEVGDFTLTGSNRPADVAAARGQKGIFDEESAPPQGKEWVKSGNGIFARHQLKVDGKPMIEVRHAGHPTALRPYYLVGPGVYDVPTEQAQRKYRLLADAKAAAEGYIDNPPRRETDDELREQLRDVEGQILAAAPAKLQAGGGDIEAAARHPNVPKALKAARGDLKARLQERREAAPAEAPKKFDLKTATEDEIAAQIEKQMLERGKPAKLAYDFETTFPNPMDGREAELNKAGRDSMFVGLEGEDLQEAIKGTFQETGFAIQSHASDARKLIDGLKSGIDPATDKPANPARMVAMWEEMRRDVSAVEDSLAEIGTEFGDDAAQAFEKVVVPELDALQQESAAIRKPTVAEKPRAKVGDWIKLFSGKVVQVTDVDDKTVGYALEKGTGATLHSSYTIVPAPGPAEPAKITASQAWAGADEKAKRAMLKSAGLDDLAEKKNVASWAWGNLSGRARAALMKGQRVQPGAAKVQPQTAKPPKVGKRGSAPFSALTSDEDGRFNAWREASGAQVLTLGGGRLEVSATGYESRMYDADRFSEGDALRYFWRQHVEDAAPTPAKSNAKAVEKIRAVAQKTIEDGEAKYAQDRNTNTARRARMASSVEADAAHKIFIGKKMLALADAVEAGTAPALAGVDSRLLIEQLQNIRTQAMYEADRKAGLSYADTEKRKGRAWEPQDKAFVHYPGVEWDSGSKMSIIRELQEMKGGKTLAKVVEREYHATPETINQLAKLFTGSKSYLLGNMTERVQRQQRLVRAGITPGNLGAVIEQYNDLPAEGQKVDRVKQLERALVGNKGIGVDFFPTTPEVAERMVALADIRSGMTVLEPSAGNGNIADAIRNAVPEAELHTVEVSDALREILEAKGHKLMARDFLSYKPEVYDRIVMNPPFGHGAAAVDAQHVRHAFSLLKPGGRIVAIMGEGTFFRSDKAAVAFREWLDEVGATDEKLPSGTFNDKRLLITTDVATRMVVIDKNELAARERSVYEVNEPTENRDLFGDLIPEPAPTPERKPKTDTMRALSERVERASAVLAVRPDEALPGLYQVTSQLVEVGQKTISVDKVNDWQSAVTALKDMHVFAVEHFDVLITDAAGKPLAVIGSFKGDKASASVHPSVMLAEALRIKGAKHAWAVHNHPSGKSALSPADENLKRVLFDVFRPSRVRFEGVAAIGGGTQEWAAIDPYGRTTTGNVATGDKRVTIPIVERTLQGQGDLASNAVDGPPAAKRITAAMSSGMPGIMFMSHQNQPTAWVPIKPDEAMNLRENNRFDKLINSASNAGASNAIIANPNGVFNDKAINNLGAALAHGDVRLLDAIDTVNMTSDAERGLLRGGYAMTSEVEEAARNYVVNTVAGHKVEESLAANLWNGVRGFDQRAARNLFLDAVTSHGGTSWWDRSIGTQYAKAQKNPQTFGRVFDAVQDFIKDISTFANAAGDLAPHILPKLDTARDVFKRRTKPADLKAAGAALWQGTLRDKRQYTRRELAQMGLTDKQTDLYIEARLAINQSLDDMVKTELVRLAGDAGAPVANAAMAAPDARGAAQVIDNFMLQQGDDSLVDVLAGKLEQLERLKEEGYAPLMRFGRHTLHITRGGETAFFGMYESRLDANQAAREFKADPELDGATFSQGLMSQKAFELYQGLPLDALELFAESTGNRDNPVYQDFLKLTKSNRSVMKRLIHRQGISGYSEDTARVLAAFVTSNARYASGNLHLGRAKEWADAIPKELGDLKDEAIKLVQYVQNPQEEAALARGFLFASFIGGSIASAAVNLTQPFTMSLPYLSQFGGVVKAASHLAAATRSAAGGHVESPELARALKHAEANGVVSPQEIHHLQAEAMGNASPWVKKVAFVWGSMFSLAEQFNRRVTFIAAYNQALQQHIANPYAFAEKAVSETQGIYNKGNKPNWARGAIGATVMTFKQFSIHYLEFLGRMWKSGPEGKKAVGVALAIIIGVAGAGGLPFADDLDDLIDTLAQALGYDFSSKRAKRDFIAKTLGLGDTAAQLATKGVTGISGMPFDVSLRMSFGNLLPATGILLRSNTDRSKDVLELAGPAGSLAKSALDAGGQLLAASSGTDVAKAGLTMMPLAVQNLAKAATMWNTGEYRDKNGRKVIDVGIADTIAKAAGFQPGDVAQESLRMGETTRSINLAKNVTQEIAAKWAQALNDGDTDGVAAARRELREWNDQNPDAQLHIQLKSIVQRVREMRMDRASRTVRHAPVGMRAEVREALQ